jgi:uncharacterized protein (TIGR03067 family)
MLAIAPPMAKSDSSTDDLKRLQGKWKIESITDDGEVKKPSVDERWTIKGNRILYSDEHDEFQLDADKKPKCIDVHMVRKALEIDERLQGVYELDGDLLKLCVAGQDKDRPKDFESKKGSNRRLVILRRVKE